MGLSLACPSLLKPNSVFKSLLAKHICDFVQLGHKWEVLLQPRAVIVMIVVLIACATITRGLRHFGTQIRHPSYTHPSSSTIGNNFRYVLRGKGTLRESVCQSIFACVLFENSDIDNRSFAVNLPLFSLFSVSNQTYYALFNVCLSRLHLG